MDSKAKHEALKSFIRHTLGCGCPEEVFENITFQKEAFAHTSATLINVGGRLLVYLWLLTDRPDISEGLEDIYKAVKTKRDTGGFNRLRLVLLTEKSKVPTDVLQNRFLELVGKDDKAHLHILHYETVPSFLLN